MLCSDSSGSWHGHTLPGQSPPSLVLWSPAAPMTVSLASRPHPTGQKPRWTVCLVAGAPGSRDSPGGRTPVDGCQYMIEWEGGLPEAPTFLGPWLRPHPTLGVSLMLAEMKWVSGGCKEPLLSCMKAHVPQWDPGVTSLRLSQSPTHCAGKERQPRSWHRCGCPEGPVLPADCT